MSAENSETTFATWKRNLIAAWRAIRGEGEGSARTPAIQVESAGNITLKNTVLTGYDVVVKGGHVGDITVDGLKHDASP